MVFSGPIALLLQYLAENERRKAAKAYMDKNTNIIEELMAWDQQEREEYISQEIEATRWEPFATTIKHFLLKAV